MSLLKFSQEIHPDSKPQITHNTFQYTLSKVMFKNIITLSRMFRAMPCRSAQTNQPVYAKHTSQYFPSCCATFLPGEPVST